MNKVLTISIAAYNVQEYIKHTLDSLIVPEVMDDLEVFIVDDGGSDSTLEIAKKYEDEYPNTFKAVHKENGGYGSTVNWSLEHATGKYFKLLDGDDWFSKDGLIKLVNEMKDSENDAFISNCNEVISVDSSTEMYDFCRKYNGQTISAKEVSNYTPVAMWALSFKTSILKKSNLSLPSHSLYTDQILVVQGLINSSEFFILGEPVYNWRLGRDEQSNNIKVFKNHKQELINIVDEVIRLYEEKKNNISYDTRENVLNRVAGDYAYLISMLLKLDKTTKGLREIKELEYSLKKGKNDIYKKSFQSKKLFALRKTIYLIYWVL